MQITQWCYSIPLINVDWGGREIGTALRGLLFGGWANPDPVRELERKVRALTGASESIAFETGRNALKWILERSGARIEAKGKTEVIIPALLCRAVPEAIRAAGLVPVLADVNDDLSLDLETVKALYNPEKTAAIVVPHIYGRPTPLAPVFDLVGDGPALVIDDAAAALGGTLDGVPLGMHGQAGIYSFSQGKAATAGGGGMLVLPANSPFSRDLQDRGVLQPATRRRANARFRKFLWFDLLRRYASPLERAFNIAKDRCRWLHKIKTSTGPMEDRRMAGLQAAVALIQIDRLANLAQRRRDNIRCLEDELAGIPGLRLLDLPDGCVPTRFLVETIDMGLKRRPEGILEENPLVRHLRRQGIEARPVYLPLHHYEDGKSWKRKTLARTDRLGDRLLMLPFLPPLDRGGLARIGKAVRLFYGK